MKTLKHNILAFLAIILLFAACKEDEADLYSGDPYFRFPMDENNDNLYVQQHYQNFLYLRDESVMRDTVYLPINAVAARPVTDVRIQLEAFDSDTVSYPSRILAGTVNATAGVQYVPFDSEELDDLMTFHAGQLRDSIGIVILRNADMTERTYRLTFRIISSDGVLAADGADNRAVIYTTERVSYPTNWSLLGYEYGAYGDVKLDFMIRHSGLTWDEETIDMIQQNEFLRRYYLDLFRHELTIENEELGADGPLREADGTYVAF